MILDKWAILLEYDFSMKIINKASIGEDEKYFFAWQLFVSKGEDDAIKYDRFSEKIISQHEITINNGQLGIYNRHLGFIFRKFTKFSTLDKIE